MIAEDRKGTDDFIFSKVGREGLWVQLAEEASELAQAASKMARGLHGTNPMYNANGERLDVEDISAAAREEFNDVLVVARILGLNEDPEAVNYKTERWVQRLSNE